MSLFSTIAHDSPFSARGLRPKRMAIIVIAVGVAVAIAIALSVSFRPNVTDSAVGTNTGQLTNAEFIELNTVALAALEPAKAAVADNSFLYWNVGSLENARPAVSAERTDTEFKTFLYWNTESIEYPLPVYGESTTGPR